MARHTVTGQQTMPISELCPLDSVIWHSTIRYDTIEEFNVDLKAEYTA